MADTTQEEKKKKGSALQVSDTPLQNQSQIAATNSTRPWRLVLFPARLFLALGWIRAGIEKIIDQSWWSGDYLLLFLADHESTMLSFLPPVARLLAVNTSIGLSLVVLVAELAIGFCLLRARSLRPALWAASILNVSFIALGAVSPSAFYLVIQLTLLLEMKVRRPDQGLPGLTAISAFWVAAAAMVPFIRTLHPHEVIEDPAIMLATVAGLTAATLTVLRIEQPTAQ